MLWERFLVLVVVTGREFRAADASNGYLLAPQFAKRTYAGPYEGSKELAEKDAGGWDRDEGLAFAAEYQRILQPAYRKARDCIDEFKPDFVLIFGDDQYEVFKEDCIPPFAVFAIDNIPIKDSPDYKDENASIKGSKQIGNYLVRGLVTKGFDVACCWRLRNQEKYGHAFTTTIQYLDLDKRGFDYPIIPVTVNCYGSDLRVPNDQYPVTKLIGGV